MAETYDLIKNAFAEYLSFPEWQWSWFVTATFSLDQYPRTDANLCKCSWNFFLNRLAETANIAYGFAFSESHKNGRRHWHALVHVQENLLGQPRRSDIWKAMFDKYGRNEIRPYHAEGIEMRGEDIQHVSCSVARYLTKYAVKEYATDQAWWDFGGNISGKEASAKEISNAIGVREIDSLRV